MPLSYHAPWLPCPLRQVPYTRTLSYRASWLPVFRQVPYTRTLSCHAPWLPAPGRWPMRATTVTMPLGCRAPFDRCPMRAPLVALPVGYRAPQPFNLSLISPSHSPPPLIPGSHFARVVPGKILNGNEEVLLGGAEPVGFCSTV